MGSDEREKARLVVALYASMTEGEKRIFTAWREAYGQPARSGEIGDWSDSAVADAYEYINGTMKVEPF
jgi:hypothetical protein